MKLLLSFALIFCPLRLLGATYYVDWVSGSDSNNGTSSATPWKHAPGDDSATSNANITLAAGDTVVFKGGVTYQGTATVTDSSPHRRVLTSNNSGSSGNVITLISGDVYSTPWGTGRAVLDGSDLGSGAAKSGIYLRNRKYVTIQGFEIQNIGVNADLSRTSDAAGVECENQVGAGGGDNVSIVGNKIHDINWSGTYVIGYGVENNHCDNMLVEKNEIYRAPDKLVEMVGTGDVAGSGNANNAVIRYNVLHDAAVHCVVLSSDNNQFYDNIIYQCNNGGLTGTSPNPGYCLKVDQGQNNQIWNNICYESNSGWGVLCAKNNTFAHNIIYGLGQNGSGTHGSLDESAFNLINNDDSWTTQCVVGNKFYNNIVYYIPNTDQTDKPHFAVVNQSGGTGNEIKNNVLFALGGDTRSTATRTGASQASTGGGCGTGCTFYSVADFETNFNSLIGGSGNVASGNIVADPAFVGGTLGALTNKPTGFQSGYGDVNTNAFDLSGSSPAKTAGITLASPVSTDLRGKSRTAFWPGVYDLSYGSGSRGVRRR